MFAEQIKQIKYNDAGLVPAIAQDYLTGEVLMLAYMNKEALELTLTKKVVHYYSRSRDELWQKGATSGNIQELKGLYYDCDGDTLLLKVKQTGVACHTGARSCFFNVLEESGIVAGEGGLLPDKREHAHILHELYSLISERKLSPLEGSYTNYLFTEGLDKILKKVGEESSEVIIAAKGGDKSELIYEVSDLIYHLLVLLVQQGVTIDEIKAELAKRRK
ncbi:MAG: bifunctional phosphoribosyl-AMP cyclohydrolase/phosphoribosyl-ATP diphosphatase HisIE [Anaerovoracaceae bacterium]